jgi:hypothetical protein
MTWEMTTVRDVDKERREELLADGWEPYAATTDGATIRHHFRREYSEHDCPQCIGRGCRRYMADGEVVEQPCPVCAGRGKLRG